MVLPNPTTLEVAMLHDELERRGITLHATDSGGLGAHPKSLLTESDKSRLMALKWDLLEALGCKGGVTPATSCIRICCYYFVDSPYSVRQMMARIDVQDRDEITNGQRRLTTIVGFKRDEVRGVHDVIEKQARCSFYAQPLLLDPSLYIRIQSFLVVRREIVSSHRPRSGSKYVHTLWPRLLLYSVLLVKVRLIHRI